LTVTRLAKACGLSRSTVLYYESVGLLKPAGRSSGNYRIYGERDLARLREVCVYREAGLTLADIRAILDRPRGDAAAVLQRRFVEIGAEIERLRGRQREIAGLLEGANRLRRMKMVTKEKWTDVMRKAGFSEEQMRRWHMEFEKTAPEEHQEFLEFLHIPTEEVQRIRQWSRG
jgi:MerR family transcriptional regulator, thiopeptide resistance regulator